MRKALFLSILLWLSGCTNETKNPLYGTWEIDSSNYEGGTVITVDEDNFSYGVIARLEDLSYGMEMHGGPYREIGDDTIEVTYEVTTCPDDVDRDTEVFSYSIDGHTMILTVKEGSVVLYRVSDESAAPGIIVRHGCWEDGVFTPHEAMKI